jgi:hypothetical protein
MLKKEYLLPFTKFFCWFSKKIPHLGYPILIHRLNLFYFSLKNIIRDSLFLESEKFQIERESSLSEYAVKKTVYSFCFLLFKGFSLPQKDRYAEGYTVFLLVWE